MRFDRHRWSAARRERLDHIWIQSALHEEIDIVSNLGRSILEDVDEGVPDRRPLLFWILQTGQRAQEALLRVDRDQFDALIRAERSLDLFPLVEPQQARIDEDTRELIPNGAMHESSGDR